MFEIQPKEGIRQNLYEILRFWLKFKRNSFVCGPYLIQIYGLVTKTRRKSYFSTLWSRPASGQMFLSSIVKNISTI